MTAATSTRGAYEGSSGLVWHQEPDGHWHARGNGGAFDAIPHERGYMLFWAPVGGQHVYLGHYQTHMGFDTAAANYAATGQPMAAEQPGRTSYGPRKYLWKVSFVDANGARGFEIVEAETSEQAVEQVRQSVSPPPQKFLFAKKLAVAAEAGEMIPLAEDGSCSHTHPAGVPTAPCGSGDPPVLVQKTDVVAAGTQTAVVAEEDKAALRFTEISFDKRDDAERFARFLEKRHSTIVAVHSGLIVTTNATKADIDRVLKGHKWEGGHRVSKSAGRYDLAAEAGRRAAPPPKGARARRKR